MARESLLFPNLLTSRKKKFGLIGTGDVVHHGVFYCFRDSAVSEYYSKLNNSLSKMLKQQKLFDKMKKILNDANDKNDNELNKIIEEIDKIDNELNTYNENRLSTKMNNEEFKKDTKKNLKAAAYVIMEFNSKRIADLDLELSKYNKDIKEAYKTRGLNSSFSGYCIQRKDWLGRNTNLSDAAKYISITTQGLNEKNAIRLRMASGEYLELHLDKDGNLKTLGENGEELGPELFSNSVIPLTIEGSKQAKLFTNKDTDNTLVYNNYTKVIEDLKSLKTLKVNGVDYRDKIISAMEYQLQNFNSKKSNSKQSYNHSYTTNSNFVKQEEDKKHKQLQNNSNSLQITK